MKHLKYLVLAILTSLTLISCGRIPSAPTPINEDGSVSDPNVVSDVKQKWSPYVVVHATGEAMNAYRDSLSLMVQKGRLRGVRVEINKGGAGLNNPVIKMIGSMNIEMVGLIDNLFLFDNNIEQDVGQIFAAYPEIHYFQVGNEITTILPKNGPTMTTEQYMVVFKRIYDYVQQRYPDKVLLTYSTLGSGLRGPTELEKMANLGLTEMSPNRVIVAINAYSPDVINKYFGVINGPLRNYRIWVLEAGSSDPNTHMSFVQTQYDKMRDYLRAERIYWYVMWGGDGPPDDGYSLIKHLGSYPNYWKSPLYKLLTDSQ